MSDQKVEFFIFRHGETDWNKLKRLQGHRNTSLNDKGVEQAKSLALSLKGQGLEIIYSSDLARAFETANIVADTLDIHIIKDSRLRELDVGEAEGMTIAQTKEKWGEDIWNSFYKKEKESLNISFPGGESRKKLIERVSSLINELTGHDVYQRIGISTHGGILRNYLHTFLPEGHDPVQVNNCTCYRLSYCKTSNNFKVLGTL